MQIFPFVKLVGCLVEESHLLVLEVNSGKEKGKGGGLCRQYEGFYLSSPGCNCGLENGNWDWDGCDEWDVEITYSGRKVPGVRLSCPPVRSWDIWW